MWLCVLCDLFVTNHHYKYLCRQSDLKFNMRGYHPFRFKISGFLVFLLCCYQAAIAPPLADTTKKNQQFQPIPEEQLQEIVVTTYNHRRLFNQVPGALSLIAPDQLLRPSEPGLLPVLKESPGMFLHQGTFNTSRITIRGIGARIPYATGRIRAWLDDIPLTNGAGTSIIEYIEPALLHHIEIIKGPATGTYGAGLGGSIVLRSKNAAQYMPQISNHFRTGAWGLRDNNFRIELKQKNYQGILLHSIGSFDGYRENNSHQRHFFGNIGNIRLSETTKLQTHLIIQQMKAYIPSSIDSIRFAENPASAASNWLKTKGFEDGQRGLAGIQLEHRNKSGWGIKAGVYSLFSNEEELRPFDMFDESRLLGGLHAVVDKSISNGKIPVRLQLGTRMFAEQSKFNNFQNLQGEGVRGNPISSNSELIYSGQLFGGADVDWKKTSLSAGFNLQQQWLDYENKSHVQGAVIQGLYQTGLIVSPRLGINHQILPNQYVFAAVSHGFSPPALSETLNTDGRIDPDIRPEKSLTTEAGWKGKAFSNALWYSLGVYHMSLTDLLVAERIGEDAWVGRNAAGARHIGLELESKFSFSAIFPQLLIPLQLRLWFSAGDFRFTDFIDKGVNHSENRIPGIPSANGGLSLEVTHYRGFFGHLKSQSVGKMALDDANSRYTDPYWLTELMLGWRYSGTKFQLEAYAKANNLFDNKYAAMILVNAPAFGNQLPRYYYPGTPLHLQGGLIVRWNYSVNSEL